MTPGDEKLHVEFYRKLWQNPTQSVLQGRPIFEEREWIRILIPGNMLNVIDTLVEEHYKLRFAEHYQRFIESSEDKEAISGTPLSSWSAITREVAEKLRYKKFFTVEQVAGASDQNLMSIGMDVGMQPPDFRKLAAAYLESANKTGEIMRREAEMDLIRHSNDDLRFQNIDQANKIKELERNVSLLLEKRVRVRTKKEQPVAQEDAKEDAKEDVNLVE